MSDEDPIDPDCQSLSFQCLCARQPVGDIYIAVVPFRDLVRITYFDVRRRLQQERDFERYLGIQRPLEPKRVQQLAQYVNFADASFPTSIIIALEQDYVSFSEEKQRMTISNFREGEHHPSTALVRLARVLDGQHRIDGLRQGFKGSDFDLSVTIFVGADISDQAHIFATVNLQQTKVSKSLAYDLYELSRSRSPQRTCHEVTVALDRDRESPLFQRIKRLGVATDTQGTETQRFEPITQATFVEGLMRHISSQPLADRDALLRGSRLPRPTKEETLQLPLRQMFIDERDIDITQVVYNYFLAVAERWPEAWNQRERGWMLNRTNGVRALLRFFGPAYRRTARSDGLVSKDQFLSILGQIDLRENDFTIDNFVPGTGGEARLFNVLNGREALR